MKNHKKPSQNKPLPLMLNPNPLSQLSEPIAHVIIWCNRLKPIFQISLSD